MVIPLFFPLFIYIFFDSIIYLKVLSQFSFILVILLLELNGINLLYTFIHSIFYVIHFTYDQMTPCFIFYVHNFYLFWGCCAHKLSPLKTFFLPPLNRHNYNYIVHPLKKRTKRHNSLTQ
jgi:hypothetical protein